jgi:hypothetical protein
MACFTPASRCELTPLASECFRAGHKQAPSGKERRTKMADAARARYWTLAEAVAWVAFQRFEVVRMVATCQQKEKDPIEFLLARMKEDQRWVAIDKQFTDLRIHEKFPTSFRAHPNASLSDQLLELYRRFPEFAKLKGFAVNADERFSSEEIKRFFPSTEGRGHGQSARSSRLRPRIIGLGAFFLNHSKTKDLDWHGVFEWCRGRAICSSVKQYEKLRPWHWDGLLGSCLTLSLYIALKRPQFH